MENQKEKQENKPEKHKCVKCGSKFGYLRIRDKSWQCRTCGKLDTEVVA